MNYKEWVASVPPEITDDTLWRLEAYRLALLATDLAWSDVCKLAADRKTVGPSDQLYRAVGSIAANIAEGYSRRSGKDQARFYEYALGSAREARGWYYQGRHVLGKEVTAHRLDLVTQIIRSLLTIIPAERGFKMKEVETPYDILETMLLADPPMPDSQNKQHAIRNT